ncbi:ABC transporter substrate-binding protein [Alkalihalobacillus sp. 1P02AB]|uniref:ABC transporter substrate-binding protein n=1 Tax=Alkalihalobacillus sp. 1P02AB TaxID=3132260 RepID=UPI0039A7263C
MKNRSWFFVALILSILLLGCYANEPEAISSVEEVEEKELTKEDKNGYQVEVVDAFGETITLEEPETIISLFPSVTETLFALDVGEKVIGRLDWDNYPQEVLEVESVGEMEFNVEKVISLNPDLVIAHESTVTGYGEGLKQVKEAGIHVIAVEDASSLEDTYEVIEWLAMITNQVDKGLELTETMQQALMEINKKVSEISDEKTVWVEISPAPEIYSAGADTFIDELLQLMNAVNVANQFKGWIAFTEEEAVHFQPDIIITTYGDYVEQSAEAILNRPGWQDVPAVKNNQIYDVDSDTVTRSGPRLVEGAEELAAAIYPEIFNQ